MRKVHENKLRILKMVDSTSGETFRQSSWCGTPMRLWISYKDTTKYYSDAEIAAGYEILKNGEPVDIYILDECEEYPEPQFGFAYGLGFFS